MNLLLERYVGWLRNPDFMRGIQWGGQCLMLHPQEDEFSFYPAMLEEIALPWKVAGERIFITLPLVGATYYFGAARRLSVLEHRLKLISEGKSIEDDPFILTLSKILDEAEQRQHTDGLDSLSWMEGEIENRIVNPGWECAGLHAKYEHQIGREVCRRIGLDPDTQSRCGFSFWLESIDKDVPVEDLIDG